MSPVQWPSSRDFVEAIQNPAVCFADPELRCMVPALDRLGMPIVTSGQFAYVFKLNHPNGGKAQAVRCFRGYLGDREQRYQVINKHLDNISSQYFADFEYDPQGILIGGSRFPTLVMEWIEGSPLDLYIDGVVNRPDVLEFLADMWLKVLVSLRDSMTAHGDLQHGNVIIESNAFRLVDLDGLWVPAMSGWTANELGHRHYQHPGRSEKHFGKHLDNFSGLVIYLSLISVAKKPDLWKKYHDENLIFTRGDFEKPAHSELLRTIKQIGPEHKRIAEALETACGQDPLSCPSILDLVQSTPSKLPAWMAKAPPVTVQTRTREATPDAHSTAHAATSQNGTSNGSAPNSTVATHTAGMQWWRQSSPSTSAVASASISTAQSATTSVPATASVLSSQAQAKLAIKHAINLAFAGLLWIWIWYPVGSTVFAAFGAPSQLAGIWAVIAYIAACGYFGHSKAVQELAGTQARAAIASTPTASTAPVNQPATTTSTSTSAPVSVGSTPSSTRVTRAAPKPYQPRPRPSPSPVAASTTSQGPVVVGSRIKMIYHRPACRWAGKISSRNRQQFSSAAEAQKAGYKACGVCTP